MLYDRFMTTQLCATVTADSMAELRRRRDAVAGADLVELRLDGVADLDVDGALADRRLPVIVTCRPAWQGGRYDGDEATRVAVLERAWDLGAEYVDVEDGAADDLVARSGGRRIVRSWHDFVGVPADAEARLRRLLASNAEIVKLAVTAHRLRDVVAVKRLGVAADGRGVILAMGAAGVTSRLLAARLGSRWTYAGDGVAPGQWPLRRLRGEFRLHTVTAATPIYGVVGRPIDHSLSPVLHNAAFAAAGLSGLYVPLAAESFEDFEAFATAFDVQGVSVTAPYKPDACRALVDPTPEDRALGAVNTLRRTARGWEGRNTDIDGFLAPLAAMPLSGRRAAVLGAGGGARAVVAGLTRSGVAVTVHARRHDAAHAVTTPIGASAAPWPPAADSWDVLVNTTPVGMAPAVEATPIELAGDLTGRLVYDLVYRPGETALLVRARALGADVIGGLPMLVAQAALQFAWWTGVEAPRDVMREAAVAALTAPGEASA